jgi:hypothetical protein
MARRVFFSFHYQRDVWRVNQIRNLDQIVGTSAAGFADASLWEESKRKGDAAIKMMIDDGLINTSVTIVCIGSQSAGRKYINYEIERSIARGNAIFGLQIHHLKDRYVQSDPVGATPTKLIAAGSALYKYVDHPTLAACIETEAKKAGK